MGSRERAYLMDPNLRQLCPNITPDQYGPESPESIDYNCIAYAIGRTDVWFQPQSSGLPGPPPVYEWANSAPDESELSAYIAFFESHGFRGCDDGDLEADFQKIAIYSHHAFPWEFHASRQLENGWWVSKFGVGKDLEHKTAECITYWRKYKLEVWMKKPRNP